MGLTSDPDLWPARGIAEYAYCPRLFYYMAVEGVFLPSSDTEKGCATHRRVDRPSAVRDMTESRPRDSDRVPNDEEAEADPTEDTDKPKSIRSLALTSQKLGLTATLDLCELTGMNAVPVEYRKGRARRISVSPPPDEPEEADEPALTAAEPWPTDRIQVGLQILLLEEAGYAVDSAVLYYAEEKRRLPLTVDDKLRADALAVLEAAKACATGARPLPLLNDPKCPRCSLLPVCLPDEVNCERQADTDEQASPRKLWPPRDDGIQVVVQQQGARISVSGKSLEVSDRKGAAVKKLPLAGLESLALVGSVQVTTQALHVLADECVPVAFPSGAGRLVAMMDPLDSVSATVRTAQVRRFDDPAACLELARALIVAKVENQRTLLMRNHASLPEGVAESMANEADKARAADSLDSLRGHEGQAAALHFGNFAGMFKGEEAAEFDANGRQRRPPPDPINSCLSMSYSMLSNECIAALRQARLEPTIGAFHVPRPGRPALALDLMEPFRPLVADSIAVTAFNRGELGAGHFLRTASGCAFTDAGRRAFFKAWSRRMDAVVTHPVFDYRLSYRRMLVLHARMIAAWLLGEVPTLAFLTTR